MLQNLANKPSYAKEAYMSQLNPFVEDNKTRINKFLNDLCEVVDFYDTLEVCLLFLSVFEMEPVPDAHFSRWINTWPCRRRT